MAAGRVVRRDQVLQAWFDEKLLEAFAGWLLPVDVPAVRRASRLHVLDPRTERDALMAATAAVHGLTVVTRISKDLVALEVLVLNLRRSA